jgi:hypothetical protein
LNYKQAGFSKLNNVIPFTDWPGIKNENIDQACDFTMFKS